MLFASVAGLTGCVTTESKVRVLVAAPVLRDPGGVARSRSPAIVVDVGADAATDAEVKAIEAAVAARLDADLAAVTPTTPQFWRAGELSVVRARIKAAPGRDQHRYLAVCRLRLTVDGDVVGDAEGETIRLVQARSLSLVELDAITAEVAENGGRIPLLDAKDVEAALVDACAAAFAALAHDVRPEDGGIDRQNGAGFSKQERRLDAEERRRRAVHRLEAPKNLTDEAAALIDLGAVGTIADAALVGRRLFHENALIRRAAESSFTMLCAGQKQLSKASTTCERPEPPPPPPPTPTASEGDGEDSDEDEDEGPIRGPTAPAPEATPTAPTAPTAPPEPATTTPATPPATPATTTDAAAPTGSP